MRDKLNVIGSAYAYTGSSLQSDASGICALGGGSLFWAQSLRTRSFALARSLARSARSLLRITTAPLKSFHVPTVSPRLSPANVTAYSAVLSR